MTNPLEAGLQAVRDMPDAPEPANQQNSVVSENTAEKTVDGSSHPQAAGESPAHVPDAAGDDARVEAQKWQPIETAPMRERIIIFRKGHEITFAEKRQNPYHLTFWWEADDGETYEPTHWMPLPAQPQVNP